MKRNLLIVTPVFPRWDGDTRSPGFVYDLAKSLSQYYRVYVLCPHYFCAAQIEHLEDIEVIRFNYFFPVKWQALSSGQGLLDGQKLGSFAKLQVPFYCIAQCIVLMKIIKKYEIDIVNTHWMFPEGLVFALLKPLLKKPHILTVHSSGMFALARQGMVGKLLLRFIIKRTDMLLPVSTYIRYSLEKLSGTNFKHKIIPMGICVDKFRYASDHRGKLRRSLGISRTDKIFLFSGNIVEKQGIHLLLQAADSLKNDHTDFHIVIIGDGPLVPFFKKWVTKLGLSDKIKFLGWVEKELLPRYLAMSDAVVVPLVIDKQGETDGLPVVIQEALACGVPLIASRVSGINDVIKDGYNGWLFEPDNYGDLKTKMELVYTSSPAEIKALRDNALKTLNLFSCQTVAREYYSVIKNFLYPYHT